MANVFDCPRHLSLKHKVHTVGRSQDLGAAELIVILQMEPE